MTENFFLNISQLSNELDSGEAIIKFLVKRFEKWIPFTDQAGLRLYSQNSIITLIFLLDKINKGTLPSLIEKEIENELMIHRTSDRKNIIQNNTAFQERTVKALEMRAQAEIKKALALEKNNEIEIQKAEAINNIATALSQLNTAGSNNFTEEHKLNNSQLKNNLTEKKQQQVIDDLSILIDKKAVKAPEIDNLSLLIADTQTTESKNAEIIKIDDLAALVNAKAESKEIDDLSLIVTNNDSQENIKIDDLSLLISDEDKHPTIEIDDLALLVNDLQQNNTEIDDLSKLINIESIKNSTIIKPPFSPKEDFEKYKSEIINIIIDLKSQGLTEEETCEQFNQEGVLTFSGKTKWSIKMISQIYELINNAA